MLQGETLTPVLPDDMMVEILLRLPVKTLARSSCVSRCWSSLIRSRWFIETHLRRGSETESRQRLLVAPYPPGLSINCRDISKSLERVTDEAAVRLTPPSSPGLSTLFHSSSDQRWLLGFIGSCNGLFCFHVRSATTIQAFIWNPATGAFRLVSRDGHALYDTPCRFGFGYDRLADDYKIVRMVHYTCVSDEVNGLVQVEILSIGTNALRMIQSPLRGAYASDDAVLAHGSLHWLMCRKAKLPSKGFDYFILRLNLETEKLDELILRLPYNANAGGVLLTSAVSDLLVLDGRLHVVVEHWSWRDYEVWAMEEYGVETSWARRLSLPYDRGAFLIARRPLYVARDGGVVVDGGSSGEMFMCDPKEGSFRKIVFPNSQEEDLMFYLRSVYVESLVSPFHTPNPKWRFEQ